MLTVRIPQYSNKNFLETKFIIPSMRTVSTVRATRIPYSLAERPVECHGLAKKEK